MLWACWVYFFLQTSRVWNLFGKLLMDARKKLHQLGMDTWQKLWEFSYGIKRESPRQKRGSGKRRARGWPKPGPMPPLFKQGERHEDNMVTQSRFRPYARFLIPLVALCIGWWLWDHFLTKVVLVVAMGCHFHGMVREIRVPLGQNPIIGLGAHGLWIGISVVISTAVFPIILDGRKVDLENSSDFGYPFIANAENVTFESLVKSSGKGTPKNDGDVVEVFFHGCESAHQNAKVEVDSLLRFGFPRRCLRQNHTEFPLEVHACPPRDGGEHSLKEMERDSATLQVLKGQEGAGRGHAGHGYRTVQRGSHPETTNLSLVIFGSYMHTPVPPFWSARRGGTTYLTHGHPHPLSCTFGQNPCDCTLGLTPPTHISPSWVVLQKKTQVKMHARIFFMSHFGEHLPWSHGAIISEFGYGEEAFFLRIGSNYGNWQFGHEFWKYGILYYGSFVRLLMDHKEPILGTPKPEFGRLRMRMRLHEPIGTYFSGKKVVFTHQIGWKL